MELAQAITGFLESLKRQGFSAATHEQRRDGLTLFSRFLEAHEVADVQGLDLKTIEAYARHLHSRKTLGHGKRTKLSANRKRTLLTTVKIFCAYLFSRGLILVNPAAELAVTRVVGHAPRKILSVAQLEKLFSAVDLTKPQGLRDRAMLELFYSCGLRRAELGMLKTSDVNFARASVYVRRGKGGNARFLPLGARASLWLSRYIEEARPALLKTKNDEGFLFVSNRNARISTAYVGMIVKAYQIKVLGDDAQASHSLRHSMATHMLKNGADIRYIQELLGHAQLATTQIYTALDIRDLHAVYVKTHPLALGDV